MGGARGALGAPACTHAHMPGVAAQGAPSTAHAWLTGQQPAARWGHGGRPRARVHVHACSPCTPFFTPVPGRGGGRSRGRRRQAPLRGAPRRCRPARAAAPQPQACSWHSLPPSHLWCGGTYDGPASLAGSGTSPRALAATRSGDCGRSSYTPLAAGSQAASYSTGKGLCCCWTPEAAGGRARGRVHVHGQRGAGSE